MKKVFYLKTCSTCKRIMTEFDLSDFEQREIKAKAVTEEELQELYALTQSYEALFSKKSTQIKERNIDVKSLQEEDFKTLILEDYRFLKRPVFIINQEIFIGSDKKYVEFLREKKKKKKQFRNRTAFLVCYKVILIQMVISPLSQECFYF